MLIADRLKLAFIWIQSCWKNYLRWKGISSQRQSVSVFYGYDRLKTSREHVFGGLVKVQDLHASFPNTSRHPAIIYLVSSALPYYPVQMARCAKRNGTKLVINQNGVAYFGWHGIGWQKTNEPLKQLLMMADHVIYQSEFCKKTADKFLGKVKNDSFTILYNPVDTSVFIPDAGKRQNTSKYKTILLSGSHWSEYRVLRALDTLFIVRQTDKNIRLRIAGRFCWLMNEDDALDQVISYSKKMRLEDYIEITGQYSQTEAPTLMRDCSILLHTKYNDPCPRLVVEAMACGLPVVYSATGGVPELVGESAGVGVVGPLDYDKDHPPEPEALACAVLQVFNNIDSYSNAARKRAVDLFDVESWVECHRDIFKQVLK